MNKHSKKIGEIFSTTDYGIFKYDPMNREIRPNRVRQLVGSMRANGFINEPIKVNSKMIVIDGQHRLEAAKIAKVGVKYFIDDSKMDLFDNMAMSNMLKKVWDKGDFIHGLIEKGLTSYKTLDNFRNEFPEFRLTEQLMMLSNSTSDVDKHKFSVGDWVAKNVNLAAKWANNLMALKPYFPKGFNKSIFVRSMIEIFVHHPEFEFEEFLHKVKLRPGMIHLCGDKRAYTIMVEEIYNYRRNNTEKINLRF